MAIIGGAGNPVGGSFTGPAEALEVVGDHAYAYSGLFPASTTEQTALSFTSGNYYFIGEVQINSAIDDDAPQTASATSLNVKFNGTSIMILGSGGDVAGVSTHRSSLSNVSKIIIPPYTEVVCIIDNDATVADNYASVTLIGEIYRG